MENKKAVGHIGENKNKPPLLRNPGKYAPRLAVVGAIVVGGALGLDHLARSAEGHTPIVAVATGNNEIDIATGDLNHRLIQTPNSKVDAPVVGLTFGSFKIPAKEYGNNLPTITNLANALVDSMPEGKKLDAAGIVTRAEIATGTFDSVERGSVQANTQAPYYVQVSTEMNVQKLETLAAKDDILVTPPVAPSK